MNTLKDASTFLGLLKRSATIINNKAERDYLYKTSKWHIWAWSFGLGIYLSGQNRVNEQKIVEFHLPALFDTDKSADGTKRYYLG